eukprot:Gregarina_sp_Poly_1__8446@NODE_497_length_7922_cov_26_990834_g53_i1_p1_GENE_NODE_497_length_7922_cov_26_990834_g53_i1NODE_497_length_7922_cov_26_990834_g53_i1_p1_ORF_typecomplete_len480_score45_35_NODE_497_length_7922_cov_26_990834_g53_i162837722
MPEPDRRFRSFRKLGRSHAVPFCAYKRKPQMKLVAPRGKRSSTVAWLIPLLSSGLPVLLHTPRLPDTKEASDVNVIIGTGHSPPEAKFNFDEFVKRIVHKTAEITEAVKQLKNQLTHGSQVTRGTLLQQVMQACLQFAAMCDNYKVEPRTLSMFADEFLYVRAPGTTTENALLFLACKAASGGMQTSHEVFAQWPPLVGTVMKLNALISPEQSAYGSTWAIRMRLALLFNAYASTRIAKALNLQEVRDVANIIVNEIEKTPKSFTPNLHFNVLQNGVNMPIETQSTNWQEIVVAKARLLGALVPKSQSNFDCYKAWAHLLLNDSWAHEKLQQWYNCLMDLQKKPNWTEDPLYPICYLTSNLESIFEVSFSTALTRSSQKCIDELSEATSSYPSPSDGRSRLFIWSIMSSTPRYMATNIQEACLLGKLKSFEDPLLKTKETSRRALWRFLVTLLCVNSADLAKVMGLESIRLTRLGLPHR